MIMLSLLSGIILGHLLGSYLEQTKYKREMENFLMFMDAKNRLTYLNLLNSYLSNKKIKKAKVYKKSTDL